MIVNKHLFSIKIALILLLFTTCAGSGPDSIVLEYLKSLQKGDYESAYDLLSRKDRSLADFEDFSRLEHTPVSSNVHRLMKYEIADSVISQTGLGATVTVSMTGPDLVRVYDRFPDLLRNDSNQLWVDAFFRDNRGEIERYAVKQYTRTYDCVLEDGAWYIQADYGPKMIIAGLMRDGDGLAADFRYDEAVEKYQTVLEIDPEHVRAADQLLRFREKAGLVNGLPFSWKVKTRTGNTITCDIVLGNTFSYMIKNVLLLVEFTDSNGEVIESREIEIIGPDSRYAMIGHDQELATELVIDEVPEITDNLSVRVLDVSY
jgi:tetratricopeptide (TPR) repeat protein